MHNYSVVIIVKGRKVQLQNVLESLSLTSHTPNDIQVVAMDGETYDIQTFDLPVTFHTLETSAKLPLAQARNHGASQTQTDRIIFLDVDCIIDPELPDLLLAPLRDTVITTAYPLYLPYVPTHGDHSQLKKDGITHPGRASIEPNTPVQFQKFWSLVFAVTKSTFKRVGGFDESYTGYGAEDTDFAKTFDSKDVKLVFVEGTVLHQYHTKYAPPIQYLADIVNNANTYAKKWGELPMGSWLESFETMSLVSVTDTIVKLLREPTQQEIDACFSKDPY